MSVQRRFRGAFGCFIIIVQFPNSNGIFVMKVLKLCLRNRSFVDLKNRKNGGRQDKGPKTSGLIIVMIIM